ncbi:hypothetical protein P4T04_18005 [Bacillus badius]|uniref:hypothetical protein n=1 Tax=Bacillus badius TaxID=1455 RepID=UPI0007B072B4|nr:hypothetical protein [Bacillus badius]KZN99422.1 hypothetical protein A4244_18590 [Bacillus badius]MED0668193.1 hypothetical protein [Bacillus badius]OCS85116.1 hypothetical protein A6M11_18605 [Bacillus badius]OVE46762.1 hypothetical protein B1A98_19245 [Bacillus badius]TDV98372.1 hypothetical protein B0G66_12715 [Bacillus badius]
MLNLSEKAAVYQLGLGIGYFKLPKVVEWVDLMILQLDSSETPYQFYEVSLSSNKKIDDVIVLLSGFTKGNHVEIASKVILGLLYKSIETREINIQQVVTLMYRLAWQRNIEDDIFSKINGLEAEYEMAVDGHEDMQIIIKEIQEFLGRYEMYCELM